jgi:hypothetical protein
VHEPELDLAEALPAQLWVEVGGPQAALLDALLERRHRPVELVHREVERLQRPDLLADELAHPVEVLLELGLGREIPGHLRLQSVAGRAANHA